jgi:glutaminyl-tRNA synthetase
VVALKCRLDTSEDRPKPKTYLSWVPADGIKCEIRVYNHLFTVPEPSDQWEDELNPESEVLFKNAVIDPSVRDLVDAATVDPWKSNMAFQLERIGYFVLDIDTTFDSSTGEGTLILNRTVSLKEEVFKKELTADEEAAIEARKSKGRKDVEDKEKRMQIDPKDLFQMAEEYVGKYSKFHPETGIPTHAADGVELTKSAMKKLEKEKQKHSNAQLKWKKTGM